MIVQINSKESLTENSSEFLDWRKRPKEIEEKITSVFEDLVDQDVSRKWVYYGEDQYNMLGIQEHKLIKTIIQQAPISKKNFYILDIGAGDFQWGKALAKFINQQRDLPEDITVHVIGIRGEKGTNIKEENGKCKIYELVAFKVENLFDEFKKRAIDLENKVDFAISRLCFRHLVDPLGTFLQVYNDLLHPENGILIMDGFFFFDKDDTTYANRGDEKKLANTYLITLLVKTKAPFLLGKGNRNDHRVGTFILRKSKDAPCQLKMSYRGIEKGYYFIGSRYITKFDISEEKYNWYYFDVNSKTRDQRKYGFFGDKSLYNWLRKNELIPMDKALIVSKKDDPLIREKLKIHKAVIEGDVNAIEQALKEGLDIDEIDLEGYTPLQLAIKNNHFSCFKLLLKKGANVNIHNHYYENCFDGNISKWN